MKDVGKKEIIKCLDVGIICQICDSVQVSPTQCAPKKYGMTMIENEKIDIIPSRAVTGWRVCMDNWKLNKATRKDHFHFLFIDQVLDRLTRNEL